MHRTIALYQVFLLSSSTTICSSWIVNNEKRKISPSAFEKTSNLLVSGNLWREKSPPSSFFATKTSSSDGGDKQEQDIANQNDKSMDANNPEVVSTNTFDDDEEAMDWVPDTIRAQVRNEIQQRQQQLYQNEKEQYQDFDGEGELDGSNSDTDTKSASPYTEEEAELIDAMAAGDKNAKDREEKTEANLPGGNPTKKLRKNSRQMPAKREQGFLGDSTLQEIALDYSVPICYIVDVLCMWDVPIPVDVKARLGDLVTGEQAFALLEAINTLDISTLHDRYSNTNIENLCHEYDIGLNVAFQFCIKEGYSLPFGVQTCLRVEQELQLLRAHGNDYINISDEGYTGGYNNFNQEEEEEEDTAMLE